MIRNNKRGRAGQAKLKKKLRKYLKVRNIQEQLAIKRNGSIFTKSLTSSRKLYKEKNCICNSNRGL